MALQFIRSALVEGVDPAGVTAARTVGAQLHQARIEAGMTLQDMANRTNLRASFVEAVEAGDTSDWLSGVHLRGHVRLMATIVGLDPEPLVDALMDSQWNDDDDSQGRW